MKTIWRFVLAGACLTFIFSIVLLLNITAPNPTNRRYSSEMPLTTRQASSKDIGSDAERILGKDLRLPNNNEADQKQCVCGSKSLNPSCNVCLVQIPSLSTYRVPDFVGESFIAESKNSQDLLYSGREVDQIGAFVQAAVLTNRRLWVYVRVDTEVAPEFTKLVESTGGGIVYYFSTPGYTDSVDQTAQRGVLASGIFLGGVGWWEWRKRRGKIRGFVVELHVKPADSVKQKLDHAESFAARMKDKLHDDDDVWGDEA